MSGRAFCNGQQLLECEREDHIELRDEEQTILVCLDCGYFVRMEIAEGRIDLDWLLGSLRHCGWS